MAGSSSADQFIQSVFPAELEEIAARRRTLGIDTAGVEESGLPSADRGLIGLALSGGGIRSATFGLGVAQILHARGILRMVDYVSIEDFSLNGQTVDRLDLGDDHGGDSSSRRRQHGLQMAPVAEQVM